MVDEVNRRTCPIAITRLRVRTDQNIRHVRLEEVAPHGIRVNGVAPGLIGTQFHDRFSSPEGQKATIARTPLAREGTPQNVANAMVFLASQLSSFLTGETIEVNRGQGLF